jgi:FkbM family methyltransferase
LDLLRGQESQVTTTLTVDEYDLLPWICREGDVALDVGANIGQWTAYLAEGFRVVHAIEPNPDAIPELLHQLPSNAIHHPIGAWSIPTRISFNRYPDSRHMSALSRDRQNVGQKTDAIDVECLPLDSLPIEGAVDFIKCDAEGAEVEILRGAAGLIHRHRPWLLVEVHTADNFLQVTKLLANWSYLVTTIRQHWFPQFSAMWYEHCWVSAQAREKCPRSP